MLIALIIAVAWIVTAGFAYRVVRAEFSKRWVWSTGDRKHWLVMCLLTGPIGLVALIVCAICEPIPPQTPPHHIRGDKPARW